MALQRWVLLAAIGVLLWAGVRGVSATPASGLTLTVNRDGDGSDLNPGDGLCDASVNVGEQCSLRAAIEELNAQGAAAGPHRIEFNIAGSGLFTITPGTALPAIAVPVFIDGSTQPGAACPTGGAPASLKIVLNGSSAGAGAAGLRLAAGSDGSTVRGLVIGNFSSSGIHSSSGGNQFGCLHVGIGADGVTNMRNSTSGINVTGAGNSVGSSLSAAHRNVISWNQTAGIYLSSDNNVVHNNYVGTTAAGTATAGNLAGAIYIHGDGNIIGGAVPLARNVAGGGMHGIRVNGGNGNTIQGNYVGVGSDGSSAVPNRNGVEVLGDAAGNFIGGTAPGEGNVIAHNYVAGVLVQSGLTGTPIRNSVRGNSLRDNGGLGIDLGDDGPDVNDPVDSDSGPNQHQNYPVLYAPPGSLTVTATLDSQPGSAYLIDLYRNQACDPSGYGEGQQHIGSVLATTDHLGKVDVDVNLAGQAAFGQFITATATDPNGNTSEFSACATLSQMAAMTMIVNATGDGADTQPGDGICDSDSTEPGEQCSLRAAIEELNAQAPVHVPHRIVFNLAGSGPFVIQPASALPEMAVHMVIDGATQPGAACPTVSAPGSLLIVLDGSLAGPGASGLVVGASAGGSIIGGLVIGHFHQSGIRLEGDGSRVRCTHIGIGAGGSDSMGNGLHGIDVAASGSIIGHPRNVIGGNAGAGVHVGAGTSGNTIAGNFIGAAPDGMQAAGNQGGGILLAGDDNTVGGQGIHARNVVGGNLLFGIRITNAHDNTVLGNLIGVARDESASLPNQGHGVELLGSASRNRIGLAKGWLLFAVAASAGGNHIAYNAGHGIVIRGDGGPHPIENSIHTNAIHDNGGLGIDLGDDGPDSPDPGDGDNGENQRQNYPVLQAEPGGPRIVLSLASQADSLYILDLYRSPQCDPSGHGEGRAFLMSVPLVADSAGHVSATFDLTGAVSAGDAVTGTATDIAGNTSEFSNCAVIAASAFPGRLYLPIIYR
jgi:trimeric autotransporter adhesin